MINLKVLFILVFKKDLLKFSIKKHNNLYSPKYELSNNLLMITQLSLVFCIIKYPL